MSPQNPEKARQADLTAHMQRLRTALVEDAQAAGESWAPGRGGADGAGKGQLHLREMIRLDRSRLDLGGFDSSDARETAQASFEERVASTEHMLGGAAARLLRQWLIRLHEFALAGSGDERAREALNRLLASKDRLKAELVQTITDVELADGRAAFEAAVEHLPRDMDVFMLIPEEGAESYWEELVKSLVSYRETVTAFLNAMTAYGSRLEAQSTSARYAFLNERRVRLAARLAGIMSELDGERLHQGKEILRRQLESSGRSGRSLQPVGEQAPRKLSDSFIGRLIGRRSAAADEAAEAPAPETAIKSRSADQMEDAFESLQRLKQRLMKERDRIRSQMQAVDAEFAAAGIDPGSLGVRPQEAQPEILLHMKALADTTQRLERARQPLDDLLAALAGNPRIARLEQAARLINAAGVQRAFGAGNELTQRLLHLYWTSPMRLLQVCYQATAERTQGVFEKDKKRASSLDAWIDTCLTQATHLENTLEQFVAIIEHAAPERIAAVISTECRLMFGGPQTGSKDG